MSSGDTTGKYRGYFDRLIVYKISRKETGFDVRLQVNRMFLVIRDICSYGILV